MIKERVASYMSNGFLPESKLGQNFLIDEDIIGNILDLCGIEEGDKVLEIGPGLGSLSVFLSDKTSDLTLIEIDKRLASFLEADDIPYYVMTDIMKKLFAECVNARKMVFMVEKDALARILAPVGTKQYGPLAVLCSLYGDTKVEFDVPRNCFVPAPNTTSSVISLTKDDLILSDGFVKFINRCFAQRRKKLVNNVKEVSGILAQFGLDPQVRAEQIEPHTFYELYNAIIGASV